METTTTNTARTDAPSEHLEAPSSDGAPALTTRTAPSEHPAIDRLREDLASIELDVLTSYTLADAMREGSSVTGQRHGGWIDGNEACALGAAYLAARARGYVGEA